MELDLKRVTEAGRRYRKAEKALQRARSNLREESLAVLGTTRQRGALAAVARAAEWTSEGIRQLITRPGP